MAGLVRRHQMRVAAALAAVSTPADAPAPNSGPYELMMHALVNDRRTLKGLQSIERKIELKREMLDKYGDYVHGVLTADKGGQDEVVVTVMVWLLDTLQFRPALDLAAYVLRHDIKLPAQYTRDVPTPVSYTHLDVYKRQALSVGRTTSMLGWLATIETKAKSLMPSYGVCCISGVTTWAADVPSSSV